MDAHRVLYPFQSIVRGGGGGGGGGGGWGTLCGRCVSPRQYEDCKEGVSGMERIWLLAPAGPRPRVIRNLVRGLLAHWLRQMRAGLQTRRRVLMRSYPGATAHGRRRRQHTALIFGGWRVFFWSEFVVVSDALRMLMLCVSLFEVQGATATASATHWHTHGLGRRQNNRVVWRGLRNSPSQEPSAWVSRPRSLSLC